MSPDANLARAAEPGADDAHLVARVAAGERTAFEPLMRRYNRRLYRVARSLLRDAAEAEDAVQEAYFSAFRSMAAFRGQASLSTWLTRIVVNECRSRQRRWARRDNIVPITSTGMQPSDLGNDMPEPTDTDPDTPERALQRLEMRALLERKLDELPEDFRVVFMMRSIEELSVEETAQCLGLPEATVRTRHFRARAQLREAIAQEIDVAERGAFEFDGQRCDRLVAKVLARIG